MNAVEEFTQRYRKLLDTNPEKAVELMERFTDIENTVDYQHPLYSPGDLSNICENPLEVYSAISDQRERLREILIRGVIGDIDGSSV